MRGNARAPEIWYNFPANNSAVKGAMSDRQAWEQLASELGFTFKEGIRAYLEADAVRRLEADGSDPAQAQAFAQARKLLDNPLLMGLMDKLFFGVVTGEQRGYEFTLYHSSSSSSKSKAHYVHIALLFKRPEKLGLLLAPETFFSRVGHKLFHTQDLTTGNAELDRLVSVKAREVAPAQVLLADRRVQEQLIALFRDGAEWLVSDEGIRWRRGGGTLTAAEARPLMERMAAAAAALGR